MSDKKLTGNAAIEVKKRIKSGSYADDQIIKLINEGRLDAQELIAEGVITQAKYDQLFYVSPEDREHKRKEEIKQKIRENPYDYTYIVGVVVQGDFTSEELIREGLLSSEKEADLFPKKVLVDFGDWKNVPDLKENRIDIFTLGIAASGKSCLLGGVLHYTEQKGKLRIGIGNPTGYQYAHTLMEAVGNGLLPPATSVDYIQYMECDLVDANNDVHPLTFIEMSGEVFKDCHLKQLADMPPKFKKFFFDNPNNKHILLAVDYTMSAAQKKHFDYILQFCEENGMLETVEGITIIITKWDKSQDTNENARDFLEKNYLSLKNLCEQFADEYDLSFHVFTYSLGKFRHNPVTGVETKYTFDESYSKKVYDLLSTTSVKKQKGKKGGSIWGKLWGR